MKAHTRKDTEKSVVEAAQTPNTFYRSPCVNYKGRTLKSDGAELYTEIVAEWLLQHSDMLDAIPCISRNRASLYWTKTHTGYTKAAASNRTEERIAMEVFRNGTVAALGRICDYQTPLKNARDDDAGKIDLLSYDDSAGILRILELKKPESEETLLRCVLEAYTYFKTVDMDKLLATKEFKISGCREIRLCPLFFRGSNQYREYEELINGKRPQLRRLMSALAADGLCAVKVEPILLEKTGIMLSADTEQYAAKILPY